MCSPFPPGFPAVPHHLPHTRFAFRSLATMVALTPLLHRTPGSSTPLTAKSVVLPEWGFEVSPVETAHLLDRAVPHHPDDSTRPTLIRASQQGASPPLAVWLVIHRLIHGFALRYSSVDCLRPFQTPPRVGALSSATLSKSDRQGPDFHRQVRRPLPGRHERGHPARIHIVVTTGVLIWPVSCAEDARGPL